MRHADASHFACEFPLPEEESTLSIQAVLARAEAVTAVLEGILHQSHWRNQ